MRKIAIAGTAAALVFTGCGKKEVKTTGSASQPTTPASTPAAKKGSVKFTEPKPGAKVGSTVKFKVALKDFKIDPAAVGKAPRPGVGHLHFVMDGGKYDFPKYSGPNGLIAKKLGVTGHYSPALAPTITYKHLPTGKHTLEVYLANNNHTNVGVNAKQAFTVK